MRKAGETPSSTSTLRRRRWVARPEVGVGCEPLRVVVVEDRGSAQDRHVDAAVERLGDVVWVADLPGPLRAEPRREGSPRRTSSSDRPASGPAGVVLRKSHSDMSDQIDLAGVDETLEHLDHLLGHDPEPVGRQPHGEREIGPALGAHAGDDVEQQPAAVLERPAVAVGAPVDGRREELADQIAVRTVQLDPVESGELSTAGRSDEVVDHLLDLVRGQRASARRVVVARADRRTADQVGGASACRRGAVGRTTGWPSRSVRWRAGRGRRRARRRRSRAGRGKPWPLAWHVRCAGHREPEAALRHAWSASGAPRRRAFRRRGSGSW